MFTKTKWVFSIFLLTKMYIRPNKIMFNFSVTPSSAQNAATSIICHAEKENNPYFNLNLKYKNWVTAPRRSFSVASYFEIFAWETKHYFLDSKYLYSLFVITIWIHYIWVSVISYISFIIAAVSKSYMYVLIYGLKDK